MPLTPQDVHSKVFGPTRFRRGYDEAEVDAFLDEVEAELTRLHREIDTLRAQLGGDGGASTGAPTTGGPTTAGGVPEGEQISGATADAATAAAATTARSGGGEDLQQQVARTLVLAQRAADEAVRDAEAHADQLRTQAGAEAERLRFEAEQAAARSRAELERARAEAEEDVEQLRAFEREYRTRLRAYLELQLRELDDGTAKVESRPAQALGPAAGTDSAAHDDAAHEAAHEAHEAYGVTPGDSAEPSQEPVATSGSPDGFAEPTGSADGPSAPSLHRVDDYTESAGVSAPATGEETRHDPGGPA